jgi:hypothetical protein
MASKADFTDEEWELLLEAPPSAGLAVILADRGGVFRESFSMAKAYAEARKQPGKSQLIDEIVETKPEIEHTRHRSKAELDDALLQHLRDAVTLVGSRASPEEVEEFRSFCVSVAEHVANARKEGFLGLTGERVSGAEETALEQIKLALGASS